MMSATRMSSRAPIVVVTRKLSLSDLARLVGHPFKDMVKFVVDVDRGIAAVGGELHADAKAVLLGHGSEPDVLWGGNYFPGRGEQDCIVFTSMINVRPAAGNRGLEVGDPTLRQRMRDVVFSLIGRGEALR